MKKKNIIIIILFAVLSIAPFVAPVLMYNNLPEKVPIHFDIKGDANRWGNRIEIFLLPFIILFMGIISICTILLDKKIKSPYFNRFTPAKMVMVIVIMILLNFFSGLILYVSYFGIGKIY